MSGLVAHVESAQLPRTATGVSGIGEAIDGCLTQPSRWLSHLLDNTYIARHRARAFSPYRPRERNKDRANTR